MKTNHRKKYAALFLAIFQHQSTVSLLLFLCFLAISLLLLRSRLFLWVRHWLRLPELKFKFKLSHPIIIDLFVCDFEIHRNQSLAWPYCSPRPGTKNTSMTTTQYTVLSSTQWMESMKSTLLFEKNNPKSKIALCIRAAQHLTSCAAKEHWTNSFLQTSFASSFHTPDDLNSVCNSCWYGGHIPSWKSQAEHFVQQWKAPWRKRGMPAKRLKQIWTWNQYWIESENRI